ncbi:hypothetical protein IWW48_002255 [Coemansia sp. RSA 1200]|nr:hypothetical protein IWW48_002255 [Coemansia sp. RSA 1200]
MDSRRDTHTKRVAAFVEWLEDNGADLSSVEIRGGPSAGDEENNAVYARTDIDADQRYAWIPSKLVITSAVCKEVLGISAEASELNGPQLLASFLVHQRYATTSDTKSFWKPYIDMLPIVFHTPIEFNSEEAAILHGTPIMYAVDDRLARFHSDFEKARRVLGDRIPQAAMSFENFAWALGVVYSRSFCKDLMSGGDGAQREGAGNEVLLPMLDMFNHMPMRKVTWELTGDGVQFVTNEKLRAGAQVFNNYGPKSNEELLMGYGFCIPNNPFSYYHIRMNYSKDPMAARKRQILERAGISDSDADQFVRKSGLPAKMLPILRVMAMTPADVVCLERLLIQTPGASADVERVLSRGLGLRIELRARRLLEHLLEMRQARLLENGSGNTHCKSDVDDTDGAQGIKMTESARMALIYRGELEVILETTLKYLRAATDELALFVCGLFDEAAHALPVYVAPGARSLPMLPGGTEQAPVRPPTPQPPSSPISDMCSRGNGRKQAEESEPDAKRARVASKSDAAERLVRSVLLTTQSFAQDAEFAAAADQVEIDDDVLLSLFLVRVLGTPKSPWHTETKRLEGFKHPMLQLLRSQSADDEEGGSDLSEADRELFADTLEELCEIHESLFPLLSTHFPDVFPASQFSLDRFVWAAGIVDMFALDAPGDHGVEGVCLL